jgi:hypothetical protein
MIADGPERRGEAGRTWQLRPRRSRTDGCGRRWARHRRHFFSAWEGLLTGFHWRQPHGHQQRGGPGVPGPGALGGWLNGRISPQRPDSRPRSPQIDPPKPLPGPDGREFDPLSPPSSPADSRGRDTQRGTLLFAGSSAPRLSARYRSARGTMVLPKLRRRSCAIYPSWMLTTGRALDTASKASPSFQPLATR